MSLAGWNADEMLAGLEPTLKLAGAANMDLARASDIVTDTLSMYGMEAEEATRMTNVLAKAQATSNTDVEMLGDALVYVGASANAMGYDIEQSSALLGLLANNGLKGSKAGTALNAVFRDMKKAVEKGNIEINGMNIAVEDADGNFRDFSDILADTEKALDGLTPVQKDAALTTIFGSQAMNALNPLIKDGSKEVKKYTGELRDSKGAAGDMYDVMQDNLKGAFDELKSAIEEAGISLGETLIPMMKDAVAWVGKWVDKFNALDDGTKEMIVKVGLFAAAIGPLLIVGGKVAGGISAIIGLFTGGAGLTAALGGATGAVGAAGGAGLVGSLGALAVGAAPIVAAVAGLGLIAVTGKEIYDSMTEEAIPAIDLFGDEVSETTAEVVGAWIETNNEFETMMMGLVMTGEQYTEELNEKISTSFKGMADTVITETQREKDESLRILGELYADAENLTDEEVQKRLKIVSDGYDDQILSVEQGEKQINEILDRWKERGGELYESEAQEIKAIQERTKKDGVRILSETEAESQAILIAMEQQSGAITARQGSEVLKNAAEQRDNTIEAAEEEYTERLKYAAELRAKGGYENEKLADEVITLADRQKRRTVQSANDQYNEILDVAQEKMGEHASSVDAHTGEVLSKWEKWKRGVSSKVSEGTKEIDKVIDKTRDYMKEPLWDRESKINIDDSLVGRGITAMKNFMNTPFGNRTATITTYQKTSSVGLSRYAEGTPYARGGLSLVGEEGPELINIPRGSKVYTNKETRGMMSGKGNSGESIFNFNLNGAVINDPRDIREIAKELATEFNREVAFG